VPSLLAPDDIGKMQILDRTVMLRTLDLTDDLIKLYALVQTGLINGLDIDFVKVSTCFNVCIPSVFDRATGVLRAVLAIVEFLNRSLMQSLHFSDLWVPTLILVVLSGIYSLSHRR